MKRRNFLIIIICVLTVFASKNGLSAPLRIAFAASGAMLILDIIKRIGEARRERKEA